VAAWLHIKAAGALVFAAAGRSENTGAAIPAKKMKAMPKALRVDERSEGISRRGGAGVAEPAVVMVVEDEDAVRRVVGEILQAAGYTVLEAKNGKEALRLARRKAAAITVLVADVVMPGVSGPELARELSESNPAMKTIFISGYAEQSRTEKQSAVKAFYLRKPFSADNLTQMVARAVAAT
jgi:two-component system, cell cycle sensor histidine kinase and response regulator CckA